MSKEIFQLNNVSLSYNKDKKHPVDALRNIDLAINVGDRWAIIGPSGCGKSTLLYLLSGIMSQTNGTILYDGLQLSKPQDDIALILQDYGLFPWKTVFDNVALALVVKKVGKSEIKSRVCDILEKLNILDKLNKYPNQLSGGQKQRVAIARALVQNPRVLLMDEPFAALDAITKESLEALVLDICEQKNLTLVFVTHNIEEAVRIGNKIAIFKTGEISKLYGVDSDCLFINGDMGFYEKCDRLRADLGLSFEGGSYDKK